MATTHNFKLIGGRATITTTDGGIIGLAANTLINQDSAGNIIIGNLKLPYTAIAVSDVDTSNALDAVTKINTLIGTATNGASAGGGSSTAAISKPTTNATLVSTTVTNSSGTVTAGKIAVNFTVGSAGTAIIDGITYEAGSTIYFAPMITNLYPAITYNAPATTLLIVTLA